MKLATLKNLILRRPIAVQLETVSYCNRRCSYCPVSTIHRPIAKMDDSVFNSIINDLAAVNYSGAVEFVGYCEPTIDLRIGQFISTVRERIPKARVNIVTNGDYVNDDVLWGFSDLGVSSVLLTDHDGTEYKAIESWFGMMKVIHQTSVPPLRNRAGALKLGNVAPIRWCKMHLVACFDYTGRIRFCCDQMLPRSDAISAVGNREWLKEWGSWRRTFVRIGILLNRYAPECKGCGTSRLKPELGGNESKI